MSLDGDIGLVFRGFTIQPGDSDVVYAQAEVPTNQNDMASLESGVHGRRGASPRIQKVIHIFFNFVANLTSAILEQNVLYPLGP
jgi:hypothetical protein